MNRWMDGIYDLDPGLLPNIPITLSKIENTHTHTHFVIPCLVQPDLFFFIALKKKNRVMHLYISSFIVSPIRL